MIFPVFSTFLFFVYCNNSNFLLKGGYYGAGVGRRGGIISHFLLGVKKSNNLYESNIFPKDLLDEKDKMTQRKKEKKREKETKAKKEDKRNKNKKKKRIKQRKRNKKKNRKKRKQKGDFKIFSFSFSFH